MSRKKEKKEISFPNYEGLLKYYYDGNFLYAEHGKVTMRLDLFHGRYYKLNLCKNIPILEIDGLRMQLVKDFDTPLDYSKIVVKNLKIPKKGNFVVLDTCMGLGYTAIEASKPDSVDMVVTFELSEAVLSLAKWNPLSDDLWDNEKIMTMQGAAEEFILGFESSMFSFIIHDPPRISHAPVLYSSDFYLELYRVCKKGGRLFHYVGTVGKKKGKKIEEDIVKKLLSAGFKKPKYSKKLQGIFVEK